MSIRAALGSCYAIRDARLGQMGDMLQVVGILKAFEQEICEKTDLHSAVLRCLDCLNADICKTWLERVEQGSVAPSFCANSARFNRLRQGRENLAS